MTKLPASVLRALPALGLAVLLGATTLVPEPSGAVALAAALFHASALPKARKVAVVLSGGNLEPDLKRKLAGEPISRQFASTPQS